MRKFVYWFIAVVITLVLSIYQRMTGPTHPMKLSIELNGQNYQVKLPRSGVQQDQIVMLKGLPADTKAQLHYRRYPSSDEYTTVDFSLKNTGGEDQQSVLQAALPVQPIAGKLQYYLTVGDKDYLAEDPVQIRFRNDVPAGILIPHILFMFAAMLFAVYTFLLTITRREYSKWLKIMVITLFIGGFILGPLVQHVAFGPWWTGFPFGTDLTDNKTLISFVFFVIALATLKWKYNRWVVCLAVLLMIVIFSIPHSTYGSEYDYSKQQLSTEK